MDEGLWVHVGILLLRSLAWPAAPHHVCIKPHGLCSCTVSGLLYASLRPPTSALSLDKDELWLPARLPGSLLDYGLQEGRELWFPAAEVSELPGRYITSAGRIEGWTDEWKTAKHSRYSTHSVSFQTLKCLSHVHLTQKL